MTKTDEQKRGRGRPATGVTPKRYFRADDETWELIQQAAGLRDESTSEYIRSVMTRNAKDIIRKNGAAGN